MSFHEATPDDILSVLRLMTDEQVRTNALLERLVAATERRRKPKQANLLPEMTPKEKVEALELDPDLIAWGKRATPSVPLGIELEAFKDRMRANGFRVGRNSVKDARRAFQTSCRNAEQWGTYRNGWKPPTVPAPRQQVEEKPL